MNIVVKSLILALLVSLSYESYADDSNYNFVANSNTDNIFLDKCKIYREILKTNDIELFKTFIDPSLHEHPHLAKGFSTYVKKYEREVGEEAYTLESIVIVNLEDQNFAGVDYIYSYNNGKGHGNSGCTFTRLEGNHWKLRAR
ncbi:hypothetical protein ACROAE_19270 [Shewanella sp. MF05960]|uniref:Nuclear transport factor 2 family protein n=1 Tax=Shewanella livingstonensis TaxID=150120 RepID=A0A3G8LR66_9GAMM|nr:hypothetical protein [Shewanella livingstonensis]AZG72106.1 hypothetical protein EGC82_04615 [Shewanella livingstonensis]